MTQTKIQMLKSFIQEDPADPFNIYVLALEYVKSGMPAEAQNHFESLISTHPNYLPAYYHFGQLLELNNQTQKAIDIYLAGEQLAKEQSNIKTMNELRSAREMLED